jgi:hypothetical protein
MRTVIQTERLKLRPLALADAPVISRFTSDPAVARNTGAIPVPNPVVAVEGWILILRARAPRSVKTMCSASSGRARGSWA